MFINLQSRTLIINLNRNGSLMMNFGKEARIKFLQRKHQEYDYKLDPEEYKFTMATTSTFDFKPFQVDHLLYMANNVWDDRQNLFGTNTEYEIIILGIALKVSEFYCTDINNSPVDMKDYVEYYYPNEVDKRLNSIYRAYNIIEQLFFQNENTDI